jgi:drug/metabolite transporter (DMT)-like permease
MKDSHILNDKLTMGAGLLAFLSATLWGGNTVSIKIASGGMPPAAIAAVRFFLGALAVWPYAKIAGISLKLEKKDLSFLLGLSALFIVQILTLNIGTSLTLAAHATVLISSYPFATALFAHLLIRGDHLTGGKLLGMAVSFSGVALIFGEAFIVGSAGSIVGDLIVFSSCILLGLRQVVTKRMTQGLHPVKLVFWQSVFSVPAFLAVTFIFEGAYDYRINSAIVAAILYQGLVVAGFCFILLTSLLRRYNASVITSFSFFTPLFGVILSGLLLGEVLSPWLIVSVVLIAAGIVVVSRFGEPRAEAKSSAVL